MDVKFITSTAKGLNTIPIDNGQLIALSDYDACFYDMKDERHIISRISGYASTTGTSSAYIANIPGVVLRHGVMIALRISDENKDNATLNINDLGAKPIYYKGEAVTAGKCPKNCVILMAYDTEQITSGAWHCVYSYDSNTEYTNQSLGGGYGKCDTDGSYAAKIATLDDYQATPGGAVSIRFTNSVPAGSTLNINNQGAKDIYHRGSNIKVDVIREGDTATFVYDGSRYHLIAVDRDDNTTYDQASSTQFGLVKIGYTQSDKNYPVQLNESGQMFVNVPWTDNNTWQQNTVTNPGYVTAPTTANANKVWKTDGNGHPGWRDDDNDNTDTNTTYTLSSPKSKSDGNVTIELTAGGSGSGVDQIKVIGEGATRVTTDSSGAIVISSTDTVNDVVTEFQVSALAESDDIILLEGQGGTNKVTYKASHAAKGPSETGFSGTTENTTISSESEQNVFTVPNITVDKYGHVTGVTEKQIIIELPELQLPEDEEEEDTRIAKQLEYAHTIDGVGFDGSQPINHFAICETTQEEVIKSAVLSAGVFTLVVGAHIQVQFINSNTAIEPTLSISNSDAKPILWKGQLIQEDQFWEAGSVLEFVYTEAGWEMISGTSSGITYDVMKGATEDESGTSGLVPAPTDGQSGLFLRGDGKWAAPTESEGSTYRAGRGLVLEGSEFNHSNQIEEGTSSEGGQARTLQHGGTFNVPSITYDAEGHIVSTGSTQLKLPEQGQSADTKNTAGSTNSTEKMYLIGATTQAEHVQTHSNGNIYTYLDEYGMQRLHATRFEGMLDELTSFTGTRLGFFFTQDESSGDVPQGGSPYYFRPIKESNYKEGDIVILGSTLPERTWDYIYAKTDIKVNNVSVSLEGHEHNYEPTPTTNVTSYSPSNGMMWKQVNANTFHGVHFEGGASSDISVGQANITGTVNCNYLKADININSNGTITASDYIATDKYLYCKGILNCGGNIYIPNGDALKGFKNGYEMNDVNTAGTTNNIAWITTGDRVVLGHQSNSERTEVRSPSSVILSCGGTTSLTAGTALRWESSSVDENTSGLASLSTGADGSANLGDSGFRWKQLFSTKGSINVSDRNYKKNIKEIDERYIRLFDLIQPVCYELVDGDRVHCGFIAQDVEAAMEQVGLTAQELSFFCKDKKYTIDEDGNKSIVVDENNEPVYLYSLRYTEYIAIQSAKIKYLEKTYNTKLCELDEKLAKIDELLESLQN